MEGRLKGKPNEFKVAIIPSRHKRLRRSALSPDVFRQIVREYKTERASFKQISDKFKVS